MYLVRLPCFSYLIEPMGLRGWLWEPSVAVWGVPTVRHSHPQRTGLVTVGL